MAQLHRVDAIWQFFPAKIYAFIRWNVPQLMQMDRLPPSFGKNPFRNLFNSLSKINPTANTQNMPVGMERKHRITKSKQRGKKKKREEKKIGQGADLIDALDRRSRSYRATAYKNSRLDVRLMDRLHIWSDMHRLSWRPWIANNLGRFDCDRSTCLHTFESR